MYCRGLGLRVVASFEDHDGFDGVILGFDGVAYHFEFTRSRKHPISPTPTIEDLVVFYVPSESEWEAACARMRAAGFTPVTSFNRTGAVGVDNALTSNDAAHRRLQGYRCSTGMRP
jgi:hypothetical protein